MKLGKKPARPGAISLRFGDVFRENKLPTPPAVFGHQALVSDWGMLANDEIGDCVFAGAAHEQKLWSASGSKKTATFTDENVIEAYSAVTGYIPGDDLTDQGTDMQEAAKWRQNVGIKDSSGVAHRITAYASIGVGNLDQLVSAVYVLGAAGIGVRVPSSMMRQFTDGKPWDYVPGSQIEGGHYIPCVGRNERGNLLVVSWGTVCEMTPEFFRQYNDENVAYISLEYLDVEKKLTPENFDMAYLGRFLRDLS